MTYQVPMTEVAVAVALAGADPEEHCIYLAPFSELREGPETMADYLNGRRRFFPMVGSGVLKMINRDQIVWIRTPKGLSEEDAEITRIDKLTIVELAEGARIEGVIPVNRPLEASRISDLLNDAREIFVRIEDEESVYYVNKDFIRYIVPR